MLLPLNSFLAYRDASTLAHSLACPVLGVMSSLSSVLADYKNDELWRAKTEQKETAFFEVCVLCSLIGSVTGSFPAR